MPNRTTPIAAALKNVPPGRARRWLERLLLRGERAIGRPPAESGRALSVREKLVEAKS